MSSDIALSEEPIALEPIALEPIALEPIALFDTEINDWEDLNAKTALLRGIYANGFEKPSPIQKKGYPTVVCQARFDCTSPVGDGQNRLLFHRRLGIN